jgi:branched-chain amino acid aminotransferase
LAKDKGYQQVIWTDDTSHEYIEEAGAMIAKAEGINTEVRQVKVSELVDAAKNGSLKEIFGAGTAAVISPISGFGFRGEDYEIPEIDNAYATKLKNRIVKIQTNKTDDPFGWRVKV